MYFNRLLVGVVAFTTILGCLISCRDSQPAPTKADFVGTWKGGIRQNGDRRSARDIVDHPLCGLDYSIELRPNGKYRYGGGKGPIIDTGKWMINDENSIRLVSDDEDDRTVTVYDYHEGNKTLEISGQDAQVVYMKEDQPEHGLGRSGDSPALTNDLVAVTWISWSADYSSHSPALSRNAKSMKSQIQTMKSKKREYFSIGFNNGGTYSFVTDSKNYIMPQNGTWKLDPSNSQVKLTPDEKPKDVIVLKFDENTDWLTLATNNCRIVFKRQ